MVVIISFSRSSGRGLHVVEVVARRQRPVVITVVRRRRRAAIRWTFQPEGVEGGGTASHTSLLPGRLGRKYRRGRGAVAATDAGRIGSADMARGVLAHRDLMVRLPPVSVFVVFFILR